MRNLQVIPMLSLTPQFLPYRGEKEQTQTAATQKGGDSFQNYLDEAMGRSSHPKRK